MSDVRKVDGGLRADRLEQISKIERWHFWFPGRRDLILELINRYGPEDKSGIIEIGCGTGYSLGSLSELNLDLYGTDLLKDGLIQSKIQNPDVNFFISDGYQQPISAGCFNLVLLFDVLEHSFAESLLLEMYRILRTGGILIMSVPAMKWLWSFRDEDADHLQRYSRNEVIHLLNRFGFQVLKVRYYQFFLFPLIVTSRILGKVWWKARDLEEQRFPILNTIFTLLNRIEVRLGNWISWPWGSSLFVVCQK